MEVVQVPRQVGRLTLLAAVWAILIPGCVTMSSLVGDAFALPEEPICRVAVNWTNQVVFTPDPTRNGTPIPGLAGRLYLFGEEVKSPLTGQGSLVVDVFDPARADGQGATIPIEEWHIDKDTLHRLERKDFIGWGYTVFLPWSSYRPDLTNLEVRVRFEPVKGSPIYAQPAKITLNNGMAAPRVTSHHKDVMLAQPGMGLPLDPASNPPVTTKTQDGTTILLGPAAATDAARAQNGKLMVLEPEAGAKLPSAAH